MILLLTVRKINTWQKLYIHISEKRDVIKDLKCDDNLITLKKSKIGCIVHNKYIFFRHKTSDKMKYLFQFTLKLSWYMLKKKKAPTMSMKFFLIYQSDHLV